MKNQVAFILLLTTWFFALAADKAETGMRVPMNLFNIGDSIGEGDYYTGELEALLRRDAAKELVLRPTRKLHSTPGRDACNKDRGAGIPRLQVREGFAARRQRALAGEGKPGVAPLISRLRPVQRRGRD